MIEVQEKSWNFQSSIGNTVRDYFTATVTPHFFNLAIRCTVLVKTAFSQARTPPLTYHCFGVIKWLNLAPHPPKNPNTESTLPLKLRVCPA